MDHKQVALQAGTSVEQRSTRCDKAVLYHGDDHQYNDIQVVANYFAEHFKAVDYLHSSQVTGEDVCCRCLCCGNCRPGSEPQDPGIEGQEEEVGQVEPRTAAFRFWNLNTRRRGGGGERCWWCWGERGRKPTHKEVIHGCPWTRKEVKERMCVCVHSLCVCVRACVSITEAINVMSN